MASRLETAPPAILGPCKASVMLKAYNHERFIAQAIESALAQQTTFPVEILVGEDCSTDRTREIVMEYSARHADRIRVLAHERNRLGMVRNTLTLCGVPREYVAWLDGDDYWISPDKLQRQVDFLDSHRDHALCFHDSLVIKPDGSQVRSPASHGREGCTVETMFLWPLGSASSCVFRKVIDVFPPWF